MPSFLHEGLSDSRALIYGDLGKAELLLKILSRRFGPLSEDIVARVRTAEGDDLDRWTDRILSAETLDELLAS